MKKEILLAALIANLAIPAVAATKTQTAKVEGKPAVSKKVQAPKAPPSGVKPTPKKKTPK
jgi:hypothetical protein